MYVGMYECFTADNKEGFLVYYSYKSLLPFWWVEGLMSLIELRLIKKKQFRKISFSRTIISFLNFFLAFLNKMFTYKMVINKMFSNKIFFEQNVFVQNIFETNVYGQKIFNYMFLSKMFSIFFKLCKVNF
jgi:hypothetical protein